ncbi:MAG: SH3 domain-containing protein [Gemmatimonadota bacterium]
MLRSVRVAPLLVFLVLTWFICPANAQVRAEQVRVTASAANIRSGPSTDAGVIVVAPEHTILPVLEQRGVWYLVSLATELGTTVTQGFIHQSTVAREVRTQSDPFAQRGQQVRVSASSANVRAGPGLDQHVVEVLPQGAIAQGITQRGDWVEVRLSSEFDVQERSGFIHMSSVEILTLDEAALPEDEPHVTPTPNPSPPTAPARAEEDPAPQIQTARMENRIRFGPQLSWGDSDGVAVGVRVEYPTTTWHRSLRLVGSFDHYFPDVPAPFEARVLEFSGNIQYVFPPLEPQHIAPYLGSGVSLAHGSLAVNGVSGSLSELGFNLLGGAQFGDGPRRPFAEFRVAFSGLDQFVVTGGLLF